MNRAERVAVIVCTLNRPDGLRRLMASIGRLHVPASLNVRVMVVDNDSQGTAYDVAREPLPEPWVVSYVQEPTRGLATVRNRALRECDPGEQLVFIDDDQEVRADWLAELWSAHTTWPEAMLSGSVLYHGPHGQSMARGLPPGGQLMPYTGTGNLLIPAAVRDRGSLGFDRAFDRTGGEDTAFTVAAVSAGIAIRAVPTAVCDEYWPADRWTARAHWRRARASSANFVRITGRSPSKVTRRVLGALTSAVAGLARLVWGTVTRDNQTTCRAMTDLGRSIGTLDGLLGSAPGHR